MSQPTTALELFPDPIGRGSFGEVYLGRDQDGIHWAVKVVYRLSFESDRPYEREYEGLMRYLPVSRTSPHLLQLQHAGRREDPPRFYYVMELADDLEGGRDINPATYVARTLKSVRHPGERMLCARVLAIALPLAEALAEIHDAGLIHRDIKPSNIIFVNGRPKLADIGLMTTTEATISFAGTEGYIPPEGPTSQQADIYAMGKVIYELLTGYDRLDYPQFPTITEPGSFEHHRFLELMAVVEKACHAQPKRRHKSARALHEELSTLGAGGSVRTRHRKEQFLRRSWQAAAVLAAALALVVGGAVLAPIPRKNRAPEPAPPVAPAVPVAREPVPEAAPPVLNDSEGKSGVAKVVAEPGATESVGMNPPATPARAVSIKPVVLAASLFDDPSSGHEGWAGSNNQGKGENLVWVPLAASGAGHVSMRENRGDSATMYFSAPAKFLGDKRRAFGGKLTFALRQRHHDQLYPGEDVVLNGAGMSLWMRLPHRPYAQWTPFTVNLDGSGGWRVRETGAAATAEEIRAVLTAITRLEIRAEYSKREKEITDLDNVAMISGRGADGAP